MEVIRYLVLFLKAFSLSKFSWIFFSVNSAGSSGKCLQYLDLFPKT